jgi:glycosyltransferase involved in cell wall biosynthesis
MATHRGARAGIGAHHRCVSLSRTGQRVGRVLIVAHSTRTNGAKVNVGGPANPSVLFISYNGLLDPLGPSQILPYLERLHGEWPIHILSYERPAQLVNRPKLSAMGERLSRQGVGWTWLRYHKWPSLPATTYDVMRGIAAVRQILAREPIGMIHCRGYLPTSVALGATGRTPVLFDIRGLQAEEYVDGGIWQEGELKWRLAKHSERRFFRKAAGAVVLTENIRPYVESRFAEAKHHPPLEVIPCCVDLGRFSFSSTARAAMRARLAFDDATTVLVYSGSLGTWYLAEEMAVFARVFQETTGRKTALLWMVNNDADEAWAASSRARLGTAQVRVVNATPAEVPEYLSAADAGLALIKPCFSKRSSSPTKYAEYLAMGIPIVISRAVGDGVRLADAGGAVAVESFDLGCYEKAAGTLVELLAKDREYFRQVAVEQFDIDQVAIPAYRRIYTKLMNS